MSIFNGAGFVTAGPGDTCARGPVTITYENAKVAMQTINRMLALGPVALFACEDESHPPFTSEQRALEPHVCPICNGAMARVKARTR